ncbi:GGDEF domain-containing protein [Phenylobacterium sp.]|uniref:GGDEF domain-containing protein n=1 Tax=Phenylobacterium sp. TaxID=1871053 RepID=UPI0012235BE0|nr:GGDEF domain-containing protein [Phenylobacterium sp.]THD66880.1 MAG: GGDEF domain-containing protein [Phenylobacterium sp.]
MSVDVQTALRSPKSYELARTALEVMEAHQVWPTVRNFELWVHYVAEKESPLAQEIDRLLAAGEAITETMGEALAAQFLPEAKLNGDILEAGDVLSKELQSVTAAIGAAQRSSEEYGQELAIASGRLTEDDANTVKSVVEDLTVATRKVQGENAVLEGQLAETTAELGRLRESLDQVRRDAMTDGLTNLANRKAFDEGLEHACEIADAAGEGMTLAIIDIDHFKGFNDAWGHQIGDQVLRYVASVIGRMGAHPRMAARYGGEEFAIIFPTEHGRTAKAVLEEIREEVSSRSLKRRSTNEDLGTITVSAGYAERIAGEGAMSLVERADAALYASKHAGRNRTTAAQPMAAVAAA